MSMSVGIVGLPNVGKSTLFNAILRRQVAYVANYPFATIEPNVGIVEVPDMRVDRLAKLSNSAKKVYSTITFIDIAGLVRGASTGAGLGNKFLSHIREVDLILMLLRDFDDPNVVREGSVDPKSDREVLLTELVLKDLETLSKSAKSIRESPSSEGDSRKFSARILEKSVEMLDSGKLLSSVAWTKEEMSVLAPYNLLTLKPMLYLLNVSESDLIRETPVTGSLPLNGAMKVSAKIEYELSGFRPEDRLEYLKELGLLEAPLDAVIRKSFDMLGLRTFLTTGEKESRAWKFKEGWNAQRCAGIIHSDFEKSFIAVDVVSYEDFISYSGWKGCRDAGRVRLEGRDYVMQDGDVVVFRVNTR